VQRSEAQSRLDGDPTVNYYFEVVRRHIVAFVVVVLVGMLAGAAYEHEFGLPAHATQSVFVPQETGVLARGSQPLTIDTVANLITSQAVLTAVQASQKRHMSLDKIQSLMRITATPNSRILHIEFTAAGANQAAAGATAAVNALVTQYTQLVTADHDRDLASLTLKADALTKDLLAARTALLAGGNAENPTFRRQVGILRNHAKSAYVNVARLRGTTVSPIQRLGNPIVHQSHDGLVLHVSVGIALSLVVTAFLAWLLDGRWVRVRARRRLAARTKLPVLIEVLPAVGQQQQRQRRQRRGDHVIGTSSLALAAQALRTHTPATGAAATSGRVSMRVAAAYIDEALSGRPKTAGPPGVLIVTAEGVRLREIARVQHWVEATGQQAVGIVLVNR
jgi:capsular polysaccharide biosynthesis protein